MLPLRSRLHDGRFFFVRGASCIMIMLMLMMTTSLLFVDADQKVVGTEEAVVPITTSSSTSVEDDGDDDDLVGAKTKNDTNKNTSTSSNDAETKEGEGGKKKKKISTGKLIAIIIADLICLSGAALFSGLTLAVMGLDSLSLEIIADSGSDPDKTYATKILPLRQKGNQLLCTFILGNVMVNTAIAQLTDQVMTGWVATLISTALITLGGEVIPQASMAAHALYVGSKSAPIVKFFLFAFYPICKPLGLFLDLAIGKDPGQIYDRNELKKLMLFLAKDFSTVSGLNQNEYGFMIGAMEIHEKTVLGALQPIQDVFMLELHDVLNSEMLHQICEKGHSRIPVYKSNRSEIVGVLLAKDLLMIDPEENTLVGHLVKYYARGVHFVPSETKLVSMLKFFQTGKSHIAFVQGVRQVAPDKDPVYEIQGIVTLEDVIEELIHGEIYDETDPENVLALSFGEDGSSPLPLLGGDHVGTGGEQPPPHQHKEQLLRIQQQFLAKSARKVVLTPNQRKACTLFLRDSVKLFSSVEVHVLSQTVNQALAFDVKVGEHANSLPLENPTNIWLYRHGQRSTVFTLLISGGLQVVTPDGQDELMYVDLPPWSVVGLGSLRAVDDDFRPDFSCRVIKTSRVLQISRALFDETLNRNEGRRKE